MESWKDLPIPNDLPRELFDGSLTPKHLATLAVILQFYRVRDTLTVLTRIQVESGPAFPAAMAQDLPLGWHDGIREYIKTIPSGSGVSVSMTGTDDKGEYVFKAPILRQE